MKVKIFEAATSNELERDMNTWLNSNSYRVLRISHAQSDCKYSALVLYQIDVII